MSIGLAFQGLQDRRRRCWERRSEQRLGTEDQGPCGLSGRLLEASRKPLEGFNQRHEKVTPRQTEGVPGLDWFGCPFKNVVLLRLIVA